MAREYFPCKYEYRKKIAKLSDQEVGRLFRALLKYGETGETEELTGRESVAFDFIADDIDRAKKAYEETCERNRANGIGRMRPVATGSDRPPNKKKIKENNSPPLPPSLGGSPGLQAVFEDWLAYKQERREAYKPTGLKSLVTQVQNAARQYGEQAVADLIRTSMASNWAGIAFDRLRQMKPPDREEEDPYANAV